MGVALSQAGDAMEQAVKKLYVGQRDQLFSTPSVFFIA